MAFDYNIIKKLLGLFSTKIIQKPDNISKVLEQNAYEGVYGWYNRQTRLSKDRRVSYYDYEQIGEFVLGSSAIDMYVEDAFPFNQDKGGTIWITSSNEELTKELNDLNNRIDIESLIPNIAYTAALYGDDFEYLALAKDHGIIGVKQIMPYGITRVENEYGNVLGYTPGIWEHIPGHGQIPDSLANPWDVIHTRVISKFTRQTGHGTSMLEPVRFIWKQLKIMLDSAVLYRWTRGVNRLVFYIDTGTNSIEDQLRIANWWKLYYKKKSKFDPEKNNFEQEWNPECYTGDTKVALLDGRNLTMLELCKEFKKGDYFGVYSVDKNNKIVPGVASHSHLIKEKAKILKINLDNGTSLRCTEGNGIMLRDGKMIPAREVKAGDSLMPFYKIVNNHGFERVYSSDDEKWYSIVRDKRIYSKEVYEKIKEQGNKVVLVVSVEDAGYEDVYDFTVDEHHNFALSDCGIFVSNSIDEDIFFPRNKGSESKVESMQGSANVGEIADIQLYINLFFAGLRIPKAFMGFEGEILAREVLPYQSIRYANSAYRLQRSVLSSLVRMYRIHALLKGFDLDKDSFKVNISTISHLYDVAKAELLEVKMGMLSKLLEFGDNVQFNKEEWLRYILTNYLDLDDKMITTLLPRKPDEDTDLSQADKNNIHKTITKNPGILTSDKIKDLKGMSKFFQNESDSRNTQDQFVAEKFREFGGIEDESKRINRLRNFIDESAKSTKESVKNRAEIDKLNSKIDFEVK